LILKNYIENYLAKHSAKKVAFGGYFEIRIYIKEAASLMIQSVEERNIHIGLDLWIKQELQY
jgi:hypothetical protein